MWEEIDPKDIQAVALLKEKRPSKVGEVRQLLGFLSYYRMYVQDFSRIAKPLYELLQARGKPDATQEKGKTGKGTQLSSRSPIQWTCDHQATC